MRGSETIRNDDGGFEGKDLGFSGRPHSPGRQAKGEGRPEFGAVLQRFQGDVQPERWRKVGERRRGEGQRLGGFGGSNIRRAATPTPSYRSFWPIASCLAVRLAYWAQSGDPFHHRLPLPRRPVAPS